MLPLVVLLHFFTVAAAVVATPRRVRWYVNAGRVSDNVAFATANARALTGMYGCCGLLSVASDGSVSRKLDIAASAAPILAKGLTYHAVADVDGKGIISGAAASGAKDVVRIAKEANLTGVIFDYEPAKNYTKAHEEAYATFLRSVKEEAGTDLEVGMDIAGWGILKDLPVYANAGLDLYTSMTPTYDQKAALSSVGSAFVSSMISTLGSRAAAGVGSMPAAGHSGSCGQMPDYGWNADGLEKFLTQSGGKGLMTVDVWRCDIDNYGETAGWFVDELATYLHGQPPLKPSPQDSWMLSTVTV